MRHVRRLRTAPTGLRVPVLVTLLGLLLAGCASIPTSGPVRPGRDVQYGVDDSVVRLLPQPPRTGASPEDIVRGFLIASASFEGGHASARLYLTPRVGAGWRPDRGVRVYDSESREITAVGDEVHVRINEIATITSGGRFVRRPEPRETTVRFGMAQVDGEWRIAALEDGLLLTTFDVDRVYRHAEVFFLDPDRGTAVPDLLMLPNRPNMATALVNRLLHGPTRWLAPAVETAFPPGTALNAGTVPVATGVADVDLNAAALTAGAEDRKAMAAQLVWTLRQLGEVRFVHVTVDGREFTVPGGAAEQSREAWPSFDPGALPVDALPYVLRGNRLGTFEGGKFEPVPGPAGNGRQPLRRPAVSLSGDQVAGVSTDGRTLLRGAIGTDTALEAVLTGGDVGTPSWDTADNLWTVDRAEGNGTVYVVLPDRTVRAVPVEDLGSGRIFGIRVSRDGTRMLLVVRRPGPGPAEHDELMLAAVLRADDGTTPDRIAGLTTVAPDLVVVRDLAWLDAARAAVIAKDDAGMLQPMVVDIDGYSATPTNSIDAVSIAAAPGTRPLLAATAEGEVYQSSGRSWTLLGPGTSPAYPG